MRRQAQKEIALFGPPFARWSYEGGGSNDHARVHRLLGHRWDLWRCGTRNRRRYRWWLFHLGTGRVSWGIYWRVARPHGAPARIYRHRDRRSSVSRSLVDHRRPHSRRTGARSHGTPLLVCEIRICLHRLIPLSRDGIPPSLAPPTLRASATIASEPAQGS